MDIVFKNHVVEYTQGLKFNNDLGRYEVYTRLDSSNEDWEYLCTVDTEQMISNFKNGIWTEVKE